MENFDISMTTSWAIMLGLLGFAVWRSYKSQKKTRRFLKMSRAKDASSRSKRSVY
jgi:hypothetical protein